VRRMIDERLRELFREKASAFEMDPAMPPGLIRRVRQRVATGLVWGASVVTAAVLLSSVGSGGRPQEDDGRADAVSLVAYLSMDEPPERQDGAAGDQNPEGLRRFVECMQGAGFNVPDPARTERGWTIPMVQPPDDSPGWREAAFVTCRPVNVHLTGSLVLGGRTEGEIDAFIACMRRHGYNLAAPSRAGDEHNFDLRGTGFDTDSDSFHRAVFVACGRDI
jgi:hypothetical protein